MQNPEFVLRAATLSPKPYAWNIFWAGELMFVIGIVIFRINRNTTD
jgi:hypothetical protein